MRRLYRRDIEFVTVIDDTTHKNLRERDREEHMESEICTLSTSNQRGSKA